MTIKELIEKLQKFPQEQEITVARYLPGDDEDYTAWDVTDVRMFSPDPDPENNCPIEIICGEVVGF